MNEVFLVIILVLFLFGLPAIIGSIVTPFVKLNAYMREKEAEGKRWIDPVERKKESEDGK